MALIKVQSEGINLADNFTFTGTVAGAGGGKVLQIVNALTQTLTNSTSSTFADSTLTASITPSSASNKVLVLVNLCCGKNTATDVYINIKLKRDATDIGGSGDISGNAIYTGSAVYHHTGTGFSCSFLDTPNTISSTAYKIQFAKQGTGTITCQQDSGASYITLMEIAP